MEVFVCGECKEFHVRSARRKTVGAIGVAGLRIEVLQSTISSAHVDEAVVIVRDVAHQLCGGTDYPLEVLFKPNFPQSIGSFDGKGVGVSILFKLLHIVVSEEERRVVECIKVLGCKRMAIVGLRQQPRGNMLPR